MKTIESPVRAHRAARLLAMAATAAAAMALTACGALKDQYAASADAQQRAAAESAAETRAGATVDTRATYLKLVEQMQKEGLWFASLAHIDALEQRWGVSPESTRMRADALRQTDQAAASAEAYKRLMGTPLEGAGYRGLGLLAGARGSYAEAAQLLRQAQRQAPTDALLLSDLGYASLRAGQVEEARLPLMQALQLRPDSTQAQTNLALYLEATGQREQADRLMETNRMSPATRAAVREAAMQLRAGREAPLNVGSAVSAPRGDAGTPPPPLMLKASRWAGTGGVRTASQLNPSVADPALSLSPSASSRGTP
ncbi:hypothetical protein [Variovorax paradoxus]|uniref:Uncharacterized protein n=1 Tax=Variovorax paradoxus TaxID=34073 RepID=A0A679JE29_VARPD|nr:hypothetical protein VVAX_04922 [Variovorax paradoxus]